MENAPKSYPDTMENGTTSCLTPFDMSPKSKRNKPLSYDLPLITQNKYLYGNKKYLDLISKVTHLFFY